MIPTWPTAIDRAVREYGVWGVGAGEEEEEPTLKHEVFNALAAKIAHGKATAKVSGKRTMLSSERHQPLLLMGRSSTGWTRQPVMTVEPHTTHTTYTASWEG